MKTIFSLLLSSLFLLVWNSPLNAVLGKVEIAPAYVHIDVISHHKTVQKLDLKGVRGEASVALLGYYVKPYGVYAKGKGCELTSTGASFGRCIPIVERILLSTQFGASYTLLKSSHPTDWSKKVHEHFEGWAPFIGAELVVTLFKGLRLSGSGQYSWSHSHLRIRHIMRSKQYKEKARGPTYNAMLEYDLNACWSINIAGMYNESFSREKNGIRGKGCKAGLAFWF